MRALGGAPSSRARRGDEHADMQNAAIRNAEAALARPDHMACTPRLCSARRPLGTVLPMADSFVHRYISIAGWQDVRFDRSQCGVSGTDGLPYKSREGF